MEDIPRGIEVLVKKASVDDEFRELLIETRAEAAKEIGLELEPSEIAMINAVPEVQLKSIISRTDVPQTHRAMFLGEVAALMALAIGVASSGCDCDPLRDRTRGIRPDRKMCIDTEEQEDDIGGE